jgi:hypothetical protein
MGPENLGFSLASGAGARAWLTRKSSRGPVGPSSKTNFYCLFFYLSSTVMGS